MGGGAVTERRWDAEMGEWRTYATDRQDRTFLPAPDQCPLCPPGRGGADSEIERPSYDIAVFDNRFPSMVAHPPAPSIESTALAPVLPAVGAAEVVVWSDDHRSTLAELPVDRLARLVEVWAERYAELSARPEVAYVFEFENKGEVVGVTLEHPHGQIYAYPDIPPRPRRMLEVAKAHLAATGRCVHCDVGARERRDQVRLVVDEASMVAFVPFAARFPFEVHVQPRRHAPCLLDLSDPERLSLATVLHEVLVRYDQLFGFSLPYVLAIHQAPTDDGDWLDVSHVRIELTPLHRAADKLKYLAGSELAAGAFISDVAPEDAAARLRSAPSFLQYGQHRSVSPVLQERG